MAEDCRCQNCGNTGRFTVVVTNARVNGQWCRNSCSRLCADILARKGMYELDAICGHTAVSGFEIRPMLSGVSSQVKVSS